MVEAHQEDTWAHTACLLAMLHNTNSKKTRTPQYFMPTRRAKKAKVLPGTIHDLKMFLPQKERERLAKEEAAKKAKEGK